jgi:hypothetical protein
MVEARPAPAKGAEQAQKQPDRGHAGFGPPTPPVPRARAHKVSAGFGFKGFGRLTAGVQQREERLTVATAGGLGGSPGWAPPTAAGLQEGGLWRLGGHGTGSHELHRGETRHKMACAHKELESATGRRPAAAVVQGPTKRQERSVSQRLAREPSAGRPTRETLDTAPEMVETAWLRATLLQPVQERLKRGTGWFRARALQGQRLCEIGGEQAALLHGRP